jgi:transposase
LGNLWIIVNALSVVEVAMRGIDVHGEAAFAYVSCEARVPVDHPLRIIRAIVDDALEALSAEFNALYAATGRPSVPPEKLLRALLLQAFYSVRSERQLMEQLGYNLLFRWFVGLAIDAPVWDVTVFTGSGPAVTGPLHRGRHPGRGLGVDEEFQAQAG